MMKQMVFAAFALALAVATTSCANAQQRTVRQVDAFDKISVKGAVNVYLSKGGREEIRLEVRNVSDDKVITEVKNGELEISMKSGNYWNVTVNCYVTYRSLKSISADGSSDLECKDMIDARALAVAVNGSSDVRLDNVQAQNVAIALNGSSDLTIAGRADNLTLTANGSSDCNAHKLTCESVSATIKGSSDASIYASENLVADVSGSGDLEVHGSPSKEQVQKSNSGEVSYR